ncbi:MAG: hypothetical protein ACM37W_23525 [Actinomycetota bacterium]
MTKRNFVCIATITLAASIGVAPLINAISVQAAPTQCAATGSYLGTTDNGKGPQFVLNIAQDGSVALFFSNLGSVNSPTGAATTPDIGVYSCQGNQVKFRVLDFNLADENGGKPASINRIEGTFEYNGGQKTISGSYEILEYPLYSNPFGSGGRSVRKRTFTGVTIPVP